MFALLALGAPPAAQAATTTVSVQDDADVSIGGVFSPGGITISAGDTVQWNWTGSSQHSVTADDSSFDSGIHVGPAATFSRQFNTPGTFAYFCQIHGAPGGNGMSGTINVLAAATATPTSTATSAASTSTPAPTNTLAASTNTPGATASPLATSTSVSSTAVPPSPIAAASPAPSPGVLSVVSPERQLPRTGSPAGPSDAPPLWPRLLLATAGVFAFAGAVAIRRRA